MNKRIVIVTAVAGLFAGTTADAQLLKILPRKPQELRNGEQPEPYITCTARYGTAAEGYIFRGHYVMAEWTGTLKFIRGSVISERTADKVDWDRKLVADPGPAPVLRSTYYLGYRPTPKSFDIVGQPLRPVSPPRKVVLGYETKAGKWSQPLSWLNRDGTVTFRGQFGSEKASAFTRKFAITIALDGNAHAYRATFSPNPNVESNQVARTFRVGQQQFFDKPLDEPGCIEDATGKPPKRHWLE